MLSSGGGVFLFWVKMWSSESLYKANLAGIYGVLGACNFPSNSVRYGIAAKNGNCTR